MINIFVEKENKTLDMDYTGNFIELAEKVNVNLETVVCILNDELVHETENIKDGDKVKFLSVISGG